MNPDRLKMSLGEALFTQRSMRKLRPDPLPDEDIRLILEAAVKAPNGGNRQHGRFLVVTDRQKIREFGALYHEAWWAKRKDEYGWTGPKDIPPGEKNYSAAMELADAMKDVPCVVFALTQPPGGANSIIPACQNLMLAARARGLGTVLTTLHRRRRDRFHAILGIPEGWESAAVIPLGWPDRKYGPNRRPPAASVIMRDRWNG